jgi:hypothetical protein
VEFFPDFVDIDIRDDVHRLVAAEGAARALWTVLTLSLV